MKDRTFLITSIVGALMLYAGLLWYSVGGQEGAQVFSSTQQTRSPKVVYHDGDVEVYKRRSVRSGSQRGGGIREGK